MNQDRLIGNWKQLNGHIHEYWSSFNDDAAGMVVATRKIIDGKIQAQNGLSKEQAESQLKEFITRNRNWNFSNR